MDYVGLVNRLVRKETRIDTLTVAKLGRREGLGLSDGQGFGRNDSGHRVKGMTYCASRKGSLL
jgi:hypothetical protein